MGTQRRLGLEKSSRGRLGEFWLEDSKSLFRLGLEKSSRGRLGEFWLGDSKGLFGLTGDGDVGLPGSQVPEDCKDDIPGKYRFF